MLRLLWTALFLGSAALGGLAHAGPAQGSSMSPGQALARINAAGQLELCFRVQKPVHVQKESPYTVQVPATESRVRTKKVTVDGVEKEVEEEYTVTVMRPETRVRLYTATEFVPETRVQKFPAGTNGFRRDADKAEIRLYDLAGNSLPVAAVKDRLDEWTVVLLSPTGNALDRRFASIFRPTTLVIGVPPQAPQPAPTPGPAFAPQPDQPPPAAPVPSAAVGVSSTLVPVAYLAEGIPKLPEGELPTFAFAKVWGDNILALRTEHETTSDVIVPITKVVEKIHEGKPVLVTVCEPRAIQKVVATQETLRYALDDVSVTRAHGDDVDKVKLPSLLAVESLAVVSSDGKPVDPLWQRNLREGVFVIVAPLAPGYGASMAAPPMMHAPMMPPPTPYHAPAPAPNAPAPNAPAPNAPAPVPVPQANAGGNPPGV